MSNDGEDGNGAQLDFLKARLASRDFIAQKSRLVASLDHNMHVLENTTFTFYVFVGLARNSLKL